MKSNFHYQLSKLFEDTENQVDLAITSMSVNIVSSLASETPVDTSRLLSNWMVNDESTIPAYFKGRKGNTRNESLAATIAKAKKVKTQKKYFISNQTPYLKYVLKQQFFESVLRKFEGIVYEIELK